MNALSLCITRGGMKRGFTLLEVLIATTVASVLALSVGSVLVYGVQMSARAGRKVRLKQDACHALRTIQRRIRRESQSDIQINPAADTMTYDLGSASPPYFQQQDDDLVHSDGSQVITLIEDRLQSVTFQVVEGHTTGEYLLQVTLQLVDGNDDLTMEIVTKLRDPYDN